MYSYTLMNSIKKNSYTLMYSIYIIYIILYNAKNSVIIKNFIITY